VHGALVVYPVFGKKIRKVENSLLNVIKSILFSETVFKINENSVFIRWISNKISE